MAEPDNMVLSIRNGAGNCWRLFFVICTFSAVVLVSFAFGCLIAPLWLVIVWHVSVAYFGFWFALRVALFPGSLFLLKTRLEHSFKSYLSKQLSSHVKRISNLVGFLEVTSIKGNNIDATSVSLIGAAHSWVLLQEYRISLSGQSSYALLELRNQDVLNSDDSTFINIQEERFPFTISTYQPQGCRSLMFLSRCRTTLCMLLQMMFKFSVQIVDRLKGKCMAKDRNNPLVAQNIHEAFHKTVAEIDSCVISVPVNFGSLKNSILMSIVAMEGFDVDAIDAYIPLLLYTRILRIVGADSRNMDRFKTAVEIAEKKKNFKEVNLPSEQQDSRVVWFLGFFFAEVYFRHLAQLMNTSPTTSLATHFDLKKSTAYSHQEIQHRRLLESIKIIRNYTNATRNVDTQFNVAAALRDLFYTKYKIPEYYLKSGKCSLDPSNSRSSLSLCQAPLCAQLQSLQTALRPLHSSVFTFHGCPKLNSSVFLEPPFGSFSYLRRELEVKQRAVQFWLTTRSGCKIDCIFIPAISIQGTERALQQIHERLRGGSEVAMLNQSRRSRLFSPRTTYSSAVPRNAAKLDRYESEDRNRLKVETMSSGCHSTAFSSFATATIDDNSSPTDWHWGSVIVFCNPNAGFYETSAYHGDWLDFYTKRNVNLVLFNYRGFGRSEGAPTPTAIAEDTEDLVSLLLTPYRGTSFSSGKNSPGEIQESSIYKSGCGIKSLGIHGRSVGGIAAIHVAWKFGSQIKWLCADRTFCSLDAAALHLVGGWSSMVLRLASFVADNVIKYLECKAYKVLCWDPEDEVILNAASLKSGVCSVLQNMNRDETSKCELGKLCNETSSIRPLKSFCTYSGTEGDPEIQQESQQENSSWGVSIIKFAKSDLIQIYASFVALKSIICLLDTDNNITERPSFILNAEQLLKRISKDETITFEYVAKVLGNVRQEVKNCGESVLSGLTSCGMSLGLVLEQSWESSLKHQLDALEVFTTSLQLWGTTIPCWDATSVKRSRALSSSKNKKSKKSPKMKHQSTSPSQSILINQARWSNDSSYSKFQSRLSSRHEQVNQEDSSADCGDGENLDDHADELDCQNLDHQVVNRSRFQAKALLCRVMSVYSKHLTSLNSRLCELQPQLFSKRQIASSDSQLHISPFPMDTNSPPSANSSARCLFSGLDTTSPTGMPNPSVPCAGQISHCSNSPYTTKLLTVLYNALNRIQKFLKTLSHNFFMDEPDGNIGDTLNLYQVSFIKLPLEFPASTFSGASSTSKQPFYGLVLPITCGHNGCLSDDEMDSLWFYFQFSGLCDLKIEYQTKAL